MLKTLGKALISDDGLRGIFSLIFISTILTIYELSLFYFIVTPGIYHQIDNGIKQMADVIYRNFQKTSDSNNFLSFQQRVQELPNTIQENIPLDFQYKLFFSKPQWDEIASEYEKAIFLNESKDLVIQRIIKILETINEREQRYINKINTNTKFVGGLIIVSLIIILLTIYFILKNRGETIGTCTWINSFITVGLILLFNYSFYLYGQKYQYIGNKGNEELITELMKNIKT